MIKLFILMSLLISCGKQIETVTQYTIPHTIEGFYKCPNGGQLELLVDYLGRITFDTNGEYITSENSYNSSISNHPIINDQNIDNMILYPRNYTYNTSNNILDNNGNLLTGSRRTDISLSYIDEDKITLTISIYNASINNSTNIVVTRIINCEK